MKIYKIISPDYDIDNKLEMFKLKDLNNDIIELDEKTLVANIESKKIKVLNAEVKLGKLIWHPISISDYTDVDFSNQIDFSKFTAEREKMGNKIAKARLLGKLVIFSSSGLNYDYKYVDIPIINQDDQLIVYIPDEVHVLRELRLRDIGNEDTSITLRRMFNLKIDKKVKVVGGHGVMILDGTFNKLTTTELDLSEFDTSHVTYMDGAFCDTNINKLILGNLDVRNVISARWAFKNFFGNTNGGFKRLRFESLENCEKMFSDSSISKSSIEEMYINPRCNINDMTESEKFGEFMPRLGMAWDTSGSINGKDMSGMMNSLKNLFNKTKTEEDEQE